MNSLYDDCYRFEPKDWLSNCLANFDEHRRQQKLCDISVKVDNKTFMAHRVVLSATIPYFKRMFTNDLIEDKQTEVEIKDSLNTIDTTAMESLLDFVYTGRIEITTSNVQSLLKGASYLELDVVRNACCEYLKIRIDVNNVFDVKSLATTHSCYKLVDVSKKFIQLNFKEVSKSDEFLSIDFCEIIDIVSKDELNVSGEEDVFHAVIAWIKRDVNQRASKLHQLLTKVRLNLLSPELVSDYLLKEGLISSSQSCRDLVNEVTKRRSLQSFPTRPRFGIKGLIYAFGPVISLDPPSIKLEVFNPQLECWVISETNKKPIDYFGLTVMDNKLYSIGGYKLHTKSRESVPTVEVFDQKNKSWTEVSPMNCKRGEAGATTLNNMIYVCGGLGGENISSLSSVECYSLAKNEWTTIQPMARKRYGLGVVACEGQVYALGGVDVYFILDSVEKYDPQTKVWNSAPPMLTRRRNFGVATLRGKIYVCGGHDGRVALNTAEVFDPKTQKWESIADMNERRQQLSLVANCGLLYAIGGIVSGSDDRHLNTVEVFGPDHNCWKVLGSMVALNCNVVAAVLSDG